MCGLLHTSSPDSGLRGKGAVRRLVYTSNTLNDSILQKAIKLAKKTGSDWCVINSEDLTKPYRLGMEAFMRELLDNSEKATKVYEKAETVFSTASDEVMKDVTSLVNKKENREG